MKKKKERKKSTWDFKDWGNQKQDPPSPHSVCLLKFEGSLNYSLAIPSLPTFQFFLPLWIKGRM